MCLSIYLSNWTVVKWDNRFKMNTQETTHFAFRFVFSSIHHPYHPFLGARVLWPVPQIFRDSGAASLLASPFQPWAAPNRYHGFSHAKLVVCYYSVTQSSTIINHPQPCWADLSLRSLKGIGSLTKGPDNPTCQLLPTSSKRKVKMAWGSRK